MKLSNPCDELLAAFTAARGIMVKPQKTKQNNHLGNKYADLNAVNAAMGPALVTHNLTMIVSPTHEAGQPKDVLLMSVLIIHTPTGQTMQDVMQVPLGKADPQGFGSAISYARRYAKLAIFDLNAADDDGQRGAERTTEEWLTMIDRAETVAKLEEIGAMLRATKDNALAKAVKDVYSDKQAALKVSESVGFNAAAPANAKRGNKTVTVAPAEDAPAQPKEQPAQPGDESDF